MRLSNLLGTLSNMMDDMHRIADQVRGVAAQKRLTHQNLADILGIDRKSVWARLNAKVPFTAVELWCLALELGVDVRSFYPSAMEKAA